MRALLPVKPTPACQTQPALRSNTDEAGSGFHQNNLECERREHLGLPCCVFAVIRAKLVDRQEVEVGNDIYGNPVKQIKFGIKQMKVGGSEAPRLTAVLIPPRI